LNMDIFQASKCFVAMIDNIPVSFIAVLHFPHSKVKNFKRVHRLVVLPDYQGIGIGNRLLEFIGKKYISSGYRYIITTSTPALLQYFQNSKLWICGKFGINTPHSISISKAGYGRITTSWEMKL